MKKEFGRLESGWNDPAAASTGSASAYRVDNECLTLLTNKPSPELVYGELSRTVKGKGVLFLQDKILSETRLRLRWAQPPPTELITNV